MTMNLTWQWVQPDDDASARSVQPRLPAAGRAGHYDPLRIMVLLALLVLLNLADLVFTLTADSVGLLHEVNPLAALLFRGHLGLDVIVFKLTAVSFGAAVLWRFRHNRWTPAACWLLVAVYLALAVTWVAWAHSFDDVMNMRMPWILVTD